MTLTTGNINSRPKLNEGEKAVNGGVRGGSKVVPPSATNLELKHYISTKKIAPLTKCMAQWLPIKNFKLINLG